MLMERRVLFAPGGFGAKCDYTAGDGEDVPPVCARTVSDLIDQLDLSAITTVYEGEDRGYPPYHPVMLTKVLVYAYCVAVFSSRKIQRRLVEDVAFRVLAAGNAPGFRTNRRTGETHGRTEAALGTRRPPCRNSRPRRGKGVFHYSTRNIAFIVGWNVQM